MSDFSVVDPKGWEYDLHSVYSAYMGHFQTYNIPWYDRTWASFFSSFEGFLSFSWPVITVTDSWTGKPHIVTRLTSIGAFLKMLKTRFGETFQQAPNILQVTPFEKSSRHLRNISDYASYRKLHATLPAVVLSALKIRIRAGEPKAIRDLWEARDKTFLAIDFEWNERNNKTCLEWGYAAVRCGQLNDSGQWPPNPDTNYRKGHYIVADYVDKVHNKYCPTYPWQYVFGDSQVISKINLPQVIEAVISSFSSPDSETIPNTLVILAHDVSGDLKRLGEMRIKIPHNVLILDTAAYERSLFNNGVRGKMTVTDLNKERAYGSTLSLEHLLRSLTTHPILPFGQTRREPEDERESATLKAILPNLTLHNSGNDSLMSLFALQMMLQPRGTKVPSISKAMNFGGVGKIASNGPPTIPMALTMISPGYVPMLPPLNGMASHNLLSEFGKMQIEKTSTLSRGVRSMNGNTHGGGRSY